MYSVHKFSISLFFIDLMFLQSSTLPRIILILCTRFNHNDLIQDARIVCYSLLYQFSLHLLQSMHVDYLQTHGRNADPRGPGEKRDPDPPSPSPHEDEEEASARDVRGS